ncbi:MAG: glycosyltransferase family 9 protein [Bacteroidetes bacterium]|nr:glycosyltransferase family 9 protein [Bacteroidota bacterium]
MTSTYNNILCIRADNMGDVIMTSPALRALKETFDCRITLLTSAMGALITSFIPEIDSTIIADMPWVSTQSLPTPDTCHQLVRQLQEHDFDLAVIFTVYSQNPLPAAFLCWMAGIPRRLALCRENPYHLLTDWIPDKEPYFFIRHQVERDLSLVSHLGATSSDPRLHLSFGPGAQHWAMEKLRAIGLDTTQPWIAIHPGVSDKKREYPIRLWIETIRLIRQQTNAQLLITGSNMDIPLAEQLASALPEGIHAVAGLLTIEEFIATIAASRLVITVNTATTHIAAAVDTAQIVLYAQTNPQHTPWRARATIFEFSVDPTGRSRNEVIRYVNNNLYNTDTPYPNPHTIAAAAQQQLQNPDTRPLTSLPSSSLAIHLLSPLK